MYLLKNYIILVSSKGLFCNLVGFIVFLLGATVAYMFSQTINSLQDLQIK